VEGAGAGGRLVTIVSTSERSTDPRVERSFFIVEPNQKQLVEVSRLLDTGKLRPVVDSVVPLSRAAEAFSGDLPRQGRGKLVVTFQSQD